MKKIVGLALLAGCAGRAPAELSAPLKVESVVGMPRLCVPMFEASGRFPKSDGEAWTAIRASLAAIDGDGAVAQLQGVRPHPAKDAVIAAANLFRETPPEAGPSDRTLDALLDQFPDDPCLHQLAAVTALQAGERDRASELTARAIELDPGDPDAALMGVVLEVTDASELATKLLALADAHPAHAASQTLAGQATLRVGDLPGAARAFTRAAELGVEDAEEAAFHLWRMTGDLDRYLAKADADGLPVSGPGFTDAGAHAATYEAWLGLDPAVEDDLVAVIHTSMGDLRCTLFHRAAPVTVINFVGLARGQQPWTEPGTTELANRPLYSGTVFHRVIPDFMIQGGDPMGTGRGFPGYRFPDEFQPGLRFDRAGLLAMANSGPDTNGSQFFVTDAPTAHLDGLHTIFGACDEASLAVITAIAHVPVDADDRPLDEVTLNSIDFEVTDALPAHDDPGP